MFVLGEDADMKRLNNNGLTLSTMIGFICCFVLFLLVAMLIAYNFGIKKGSPNPLYEEVPTDEELAK